MDIEDLLAAAKNLPFEKLVEKLNIIVRQDYHYKNLDQGNKKIVLDLIKKHLPKIRSGVGISAMTAREEMYRLYQNRIKLNLTEEDIKDIREILELFKK